MPSAISVASISGLRISRMLRWTSELVSLAISPLSFSMSVPFLHGGVSRTGRDRMVAEFQSGVACLEEFAGGAVLDDGAALGSLRRLGEKRDGEEKREEAGDGVEHVVQAKSSLMGEASLGTRRMGRPWGV